MPAAYNLKIDERSDQTKMKLRLFTAAMLQAVGLALRLNADGNAVAKPESMSEAELKTEQEATDFYRGCLQKALQDKIM